MKFAVNYSIPLAQFLENNPEQVDLIKCPDWDGLFIEAAKVKPVYIHFDILVGKDQAKHLDLERVERFLAHTSTPHVNCHLVTTRETNPSSTKDVTVMLKQWEKEISVLSSHFGNNHVVIEHFPFMPYHPYMKAAVDAKNISTIINETGCSFLLDLAHARITAQVLGVDAQDYIMALPIRQLQELHITGMRLYNGLWHDHFELLDSDWTLLEWILAMVKKHEIPEPAIASFEYGGVGNTFAWRTEPGVIQNQVPRLYAMIKSC